MKTAILPPNSPYILYFLAAFFLNTPVALASFCPQIRRQEALLSEETKQAIQLEIRIPNQEAQTVLPDRLCNLLEARERTTILHYRALQTQGAATVAAGAPEDGVGGQAGVAAAALRAQGRARASQQHTGTQLAADTLVLQRLSDSTKQMIEKIRTHSLAAQRLVEQRESQQMTSQRRHALHADVAALRLIEMPLSVAHRGAEATLVASRRVLAEIRVNVAQLEALAGASGESRQALRSLLSVEGEGDAPLSPAIQARRADVTGAVFDRHLTEYADDIAQASPPGAREQGALGAGDAREIEREGDNLALEGCRATPRPAHCQDLMREICQGEAQPENCRALAPPAPAPAPRAAAVPRPPRPAASPAPAPPPIASPPPVAATPPPVTQTPLVAGAQTPPPGSNSNWLEEHWPVAAIGGAALVGGAIVLSQKDKNKTPQNTGPPQAGVNLKANEPFFCYRVSPDSTECTTLSPENFPRGNPAEFPTGDAVPRLLCSFDNSCVPIANGQITNIFSGQKLCLSADVCGQPLP